MIANLQDRGGWGAVSLRKLAQELEVSVTYLSKINHGKEIVSERVYLKMARLLKASSERPAKAKP